MNLNSQLLLIAMSAVFVCGCSAQGTVPSDAQDPQGELVVDNEQPEDEAIYGDTVCRYERTVSSRIGKRVCKTRAQIEAERELARESLEQNAIRTDQDRIVTQ